MAAAASDLEPLVDALVATPLDDLPVERLQLRIATVGPQVDRLRGLDRLQRSVAVPTWRRRPSRPVRASVDGVDDASGRLAHEQARCMSDRTVPA